MRSKRFETSFVDYDLLDSFYKYYISNDKRAVKELHVDIKTFQFTISF